MYNWRVEARKHLTEAKHESARPQPRKRKQPSQTKNQAKARAGKKGARQRWLDDLTMHRELERLRGGFAGESWRARIRHALLRYLFLWRANNRKLPPDARQELAAIGTGLSTEMLGHLIRLPSHDDKPNSKPLLHVPLTHARIRVWLKITPEEEAQARAKPAPKPKPPSPREQKMAERLAAVCMACDWLQRHRLPATVTAVQERVRASGIKASRASIHSDLQKLAR